MMKAGTYYVGDLCYVFSDERWNEVCDVTILGRYVFSGEFTLADGTPFAMYNTKHGDGVYSDNFGHDYPVDAGVIGCIDVKHIDADVMKGIMERGMGHFFTFKNEFETGYDDAEKSVITFGETVFIDTDPQYEEED